MDEKGNTYSIPTGSTDYKIDAKTDKDEYAEIYTYGGKLCLSELNHVVIHLEKK